jgi:hypothetical protein
MSIDERDVFTTAIAAWLEAAQSSGNAFTARFGHYSFLMSLISLIVVACGRCFATHSNTPAFFLPFTCFVYHFQNRSSDSKSAIFDIQTQILILVCGANSLSLEQNG